MTLVRKRAENCELINQIIIQYFYYWYVEGRCPLVHATYYDLLKCILTDPKRFYPDPQLSFGPELDLEPTLSLDHCTKVFCIFVASLGNMYCTGITSVTL